MFRRRRSEPDPQPPQPPTDDSTQADNVAGAIRDDAEEQQPAGDGGEPGDGSLEGHPDAVAAPGRPQGPWDAEDAPELDEPGRLDLGGLQVPVVDGVEVRVEVAQEGPVVAVTLVDGESLMQLGAFAAPRSEGIWGEIRAEIAASLVAGGGSAQDEPGPFGTELRARVPAETGQGQQPQPARFVGVDAPRWFLRAVVTGPAATNPEQARLLEQVLRDVVVVRGKDAMGVRDQIPLRLPKEAQAGAAPQAVDGTPDLNPFQRGPEITEVR